MDFQPTDLKVVPTESPEALWEEFEKTGSVQTYLRYCRAVEMTENLVPSKLPS